MKITIEYCPNNYNRIRTGFVFIDRWTYCHTQLKKLKEWLNYFGFNVIGDAVLNEDLTFTIRTEKPVANSILESMLEDLGTFKLLSTE